MPVVDPLDGATLVGLARGRGVMIALLKRASGATVSLGPRDTLGD